MSSRTAAKLREAATHLKPTSLTDEPVGVFTLRQAGMRAYARKPTVAHLADIDRQCWTEMLNPFDRQNVRFMYLHFLAEYFDADFQYT